MIQLSSAQFRKLIIALAVYLASLFAANTLGTKLMPFIWGANLSVAVFSFPIVFLMTDVIGEVFGKKIAKFFVLAGFIATALFIGYSFLSIAMPWSPVSGWLTESYNTVFGMSIRIAVASIAAFLIAEYQDVIAFFFFKDRIKQAHFWFRSFLSNVWSQFLDTVIFMIIAFAGVYSWPTLISIILSWWLFKVVMGLLYTPLAYAGIWFLKDREGTTGKN